MGTKEDADLVRRGYEAFSAGDMETLTGLFAEDAVWHASGHTELSGTKQGRDAIFGYFAELFSRSDGTVKVTVDDVIAGENHTVVLDHIHAERGGNVLDENGVNVFRIQDGLVVEVTQFSVDTERNGAFWS
jgi:ketosteroid isomerase-like protein